MYIINLNKIQKLVLDLFNFFCINTKLQQMKIQVDLQVNNTVFLNCYEKNPYTICIFIGNIISKL